jgi:cytochrome P450
MARLETILLRDHIGIAGKVAVTWFGPEPRVVVTDPKLFREILANKHGQFGKQKSILRIERLLANGLTTHQGEKWVTHRRIINHAFHLEKLKVLCLSQLSLTSERTAQYSRMLKREVD